MAGAQKKAAPAKKAQGPKAGTKKSVLDSRVKRAEQGKLVYTIDCSIPSSDGLVETQTIDKFAEYLQTHIKVNNKTGNLGDKCKVAVEDNKVTVTNKQVLFPKRYLKFLTRKFLRQEKLRDYLRPVSTVKGEYQLRYYNIHLDEEE
eukprot:Hpha_TRINITY_DN14653_c0_g2::TRINITY_DN14653_c0_g2_i1::g.48272::m.48272/K02891/RP-L22e, RPL22; large subunit ribosomal protein L22e